MSLSSTYYINQVPRPQQVAKFEVKYPGFYMQAPNNIVFLGGIRDRKQRDILCIEIKYILFQINAIFYSLR